MGSQHAPFWGFFSIYAYILCCRTAKFDVVTHMGRGFVYRGQPRLPSQETGVAGLPNFGGSPAFMPTPINKEQSNSAW